MGGKGRGPIRLVPHCGVVRDPSGPLLPGGRTPGAGARDGLSDHLRPADGEPGLADYVAFDQDRVVVEVTDEDDGDEERDVTVKRFPTWGDAAHLVDVMDVRPTDEGLQLRHGRPERRPTARRRGQPDARPGHRGRRPACRGPPRRRGQHDLPAVGRCPSAAALGTGRAQLRPHVLRLGGPGVPARPPVRRGHAAARRALRRRHPARAGPSGRGRDRYDANRTIWA